jgi:hypothetical protein
MRLLFELCAQLAFLYALDSLRDFLFVPFNCLGELLLEFFKASSLPLRPLGLQTPFFFGEFLRGARSFAL